MGMTKSVKKSLKSRGRNSSNEGHIFSSGEIVQVMILQKGEFVYQWVKGTFLKVIRTTVSARKTLSGGRDTIGGGDPFAHQGVMAGSSAGLMVPTNELPADKSYIVNVENYKHYKLESASLKAPWYCVRRLPKNADIIVPYTLKPAIEPTEPKCIKRGHILKEILYSEKSYFGGLVKLLKNYYDPLGANKIIPKMDVVKLVSKVEAMDTFHRVMLVELSRTENLAAVFLKNADFLRMYTSYTNGYEDMLKFIDDLRTNNKAFKKHLDHVEKKLSCPINTLLITPIQRVPRYKLLLDDLLAKTQLDHPQRVTLMAAVDKISAIASHINEQKARIENMNSFYKVSKILKGAGDDLWAPDRKFKSYGVLWRKSTSLFRTNTECQIFLFSDVLCYCEKNCVFTRMVKLQDIKIIKNFTDEEDFPGLFGIEIVIANEESIRVGVKENKSRQSWIDAILDARELDKS